MMRWVFALVVLWASSAYGATFYISTTGSDTNACTNQTTDACASFPRCAAVMSAGDTCIAKAGTYSIAPGANRKGWFMFSGGGGTAGNVKTFKGESATTVILVPQSYFDVTQIATITIGNSALDYVTFSDFTMYGRFNFNEALADAADYVTLERIIFRCPGAAGVGNTLSVMANQLNYDSNADGTTDSTTPRDGLVIRDNMFDIDSSCPTGVYDQDSTGNALYRPDFMHIYSTSGAVIENNDFYFTDPSKVPQISTDPKIRMALWFKGRAEYARARYNYCEGDFGACISINTGKCPDGLSCNIISSEVDSNGDNQAYQNISYQSGSIGWDSNNYADGDAVYNNTLYRPAHGSITVSPSTGTANRARRNLSYYNNIVYASDSDTYFSTYFYLDSYLNTHADDVCTSTILDYNMYYPVTGSRSRNFANDADNSSTLTDWQTYLTAACSNASVRETSSRTSDPLFVDAAGGDLHLQGGSPALTGGRGGSYASVLGAYITGTEQIGCSFHPSCYSYNVAEAPSTSGNPRRVDMRGVSFK